MVTEDESWFQYDYAPREMDVGPEKMTFWYFDRTRCSKSDDDNVVHVHDVDCFETIADEKEMRSRFFRPHIAARINKRKNDNFRREIPVHLSGSRRDRFPQNLIKKRTFSDQKL
jgi:hypothetical protein